MRGVPLAVARALAGTRIGRRLGREAYAALARAVAFHLARIPDVLAVYGTGSLLGLETLSPGDSDIDLTVIVRAESLEREVAARRALRASHAHLLRFGGLFHGLDPTTDDELPLHRAFGNAWALELDQGGLCLAGEPQWRSPARRPPHEVARERFTQAVRRWVNGAGLLLDPRVELAPSARRRSSCKLLADVGFAWVGAARHRPLADLSRELEARGVPTPWASAAGAFDAELGAGFDVLGRFARELAPGGVPFSPTVTEPEPPSMHGLSGLASRVLGGPLATLTVYRRAPSLDDWVPVILARPDADAELTVQTARERLAKAGGVLAQLHPHLRRPVVLPSAVWSAAALLDPAPFAGAGATRAPSWGEPLPPIFAPSTEDLAALVRARTVESFTLLSAVDFRGRPEPARLSRDLTRRFGRLLPALRAAARDGVLDTGAGLVAAPVPETEEGRVAVMRAWRAERATALRPLLGDRLPP